MTAALAVLALSLSGCGDETGQTVPAPTASAASQADGTQAAQTGLLNAVKAGETYRYLVWNVTDPNNPYEAITDSLAAVWHKKREAIQEKYGITIEYVKSPEGSWDSTAMEAAYTGMPLADIVDLGGNYNVLRFYNYNGQPGAIMAPLSDYSQYADFNDEAYWDTQLQETCIFQDKLWYCVPRVNGVGNVSFNMVTFIDKNVMAAKGISVQELYELNQNGSLWTLTNLADKTMGYKIWNYSNAVTAPFSDMSVILRILDGSTTAQTHFDSVADSINYALESEQGLQ